MSRTVSLTPSDGTPTATEHELIGARIGHIRIVDLIGSGGMGAVYTGLDEKLERQVAIKAIRHDRKLDAEATARFQREARALSRLEHPNICQIHDIIEEEGLGHFLVLEKIDGRSLDTIVEDELPSTTKLSIAHQIAGVLVAAHESGVVHRDLKPANVMVTESGAVKVLDFGLSRLLDEGGRLPLQVPDGSDEPQSEQPRTRREDGLETQLGTILGTVSYMSPEQARGEPAGPASDMYSFGLMLQELLTGQPPYDPAANPALKLTMAAQAQTRPVEGLDPELTRLVNRLKALNPGGRPSAQDAAERLRWIRNRPKRRVRRIAIAAIMSVLALLSAALAVQSLRIAGERDRAERETAKATAINRFVQETLGAADPLLGEGREITLLEALSAAVNKIDEELADQPEIAAAVRSTFGKTYLGLGRYDEAEVLFKKALEDRQEVFGGEHPEVASSLQDLGVLRWRQGDLKAAEDLLRQSLAMIRNLSGDRTAALEVLMDLAGVLEHQDRYGEAESLAREAVTVAGTAFGENDPRVGAALNDLAWILYRKGENEDAERLFRHSLRLRREGLGPEHPRVALTMSNLAVVLMEQGKNDEAESYVRSCLAIRRNALGEDHADVADSLHLLAVLRRRAGAVDEAETLLRKAVAVRQRAVGEVHTSVATHLDQLASVLSDKGELEEAERVRREVLDIYRNLGDEGRPLFLATALQNLAFTLARAKRYEDAEPLYREALDIYAGVYGTDHWIIANTRANLGACLTKLGRFAEAEDLLLEAHENLLTTFGEEHARVQKTTRFLEELRDSWGRPRPESAVSPAD